MPLLPIEHTRNNLDEIFCILFGHILRAGEENEEQFWSLSSDSRRMAKSLFGSIKFASFGHGSTINHRNKNSSNWSLISFHYFKTNYFDIFIENFILA